MLIATAGHIDHGKTALVRALTGVETDRLPEERARGISIDLGFAYWRPDEDRTIGFIDVPGHERFVRNMLAGVGGIHLALLVVAADDGVMPQSLEHVQILDLLGVSRGLVAITKCDRAAPERIAAVRDQVRALLAPTRLAEAPVFEVSSVTGAGLDDLGGALRAAADAETPRLGAGRAFRLAIDRAFSVTGAGTVVTGTARDGTLEVGERLILSPRGLDVRVRGLQSGGRAATRVEAGERCAVNLAGVDLAKVHRGDWLLMPDMHAPTSRLEVRLSVLASKGEPLKHHSPAHLHLGTADIAARVMIPGQAAIPPGGEAIVQLVLEQPTCAVTGDRFVLRDPSGRRTIGGGVVVDPFATGDRRGAAGRAAVSAALQRTVPAEALATLLAIPGYEIDARRFELGFNLQAHAAQALYAASGAALIGALALPAARVDAVREHMLDTLRAFHREQPQAEGMIPRDLRATLPDPVSPEAFLALVKDLADARRIISTGQRLKLAGHVASFSPADRALWQTLKPWLEERGAAPFTPAELAREARASEAVIKALLHGRRAAGEVWRIVGERFLLGEQVAALAARAAVVGETVGGTGFTAAQFRDAIGTGRGWAIHILEFFDGLGVTARRGDLRRMRPDYETLVGPAEPYTPASG